MRLIELNRKPQRRQIRQFGCLAAVLLPVIGAFSSGGEMSIVAVCGAIGLLAAAASWIFPRAVAPVFVGLCLVSFPVGLIVSELLLLLIFAVVLAPLAVLARASGRDRLQLKLDRSADSYWNKRPGSPSLESYFNYW